jgi:hypothetical protein
MIIPITHVMSTPYAKITSVSLQQRSRSDGRSREKVCIRGRMGFVLDGGV